jgi:hypothetical protein
VGKVLLQEVFMHIKSPEFLKLQDNYSTLMRTLRKFLTDLEYMKQVSFLRGMKRKVIEKALSLGLLKHEIPFLPVLQHSLRSERKNIPLSRQITFVRLTGGGGNEIEGTFSINLNKVSNIKVNTPSNYPYYILGVNLNKVNNSLTVGEMMEKIKESKEKALNLAEVISLVIHKPELLKNHVILACGSQYIEQGNGEVKNVPCVQLCNVQPTISWKKISDKSPSFISPSCIEILETTILISAKTIIQGRPWKRIGPI